MRLESLQMQTITCYKHVMKKLLVSILVGSVMGCSVTSLQCGVDGDSSFVNLNTTPQTLSQQSRNMAELCSFNYQDE